MVSIRDGDTINGSLDGVEGSFARANAGGCVFIRDLGEAGFTGFHNGISFTSDGGTAQAVTPISLGPTVAADYLALGYWLYVPKDVTVAEDYDFGVFASGGDRFKTVNLAGLTGSATYAGSAAGWYYVDDSSGSPVSGGFDASVMLTAEFGDATEIGTLAGTLSGFDWSAEVASSLPAWVNLTTDNWKGHTERYGHDHSYDMYEVVRGESNIFDTPYGTNSNAYNGGHVLGLTEADVGGTHWNGEWSSAFFGNDPNDPSAHPTSIAGTFHASDNVTAGLTGSFGAHRQDDSQ